MSVKIEQAINDLSKGILKVKPGVSDAWNTMMLGSCVVSIMTLRLQVMRLYNELPKTTKAKKHRRKLSSYLDAVREIEKQDMDSSTYVREILMPLKELRTDFKKWVKEGSLKNILKPHQIKIILKKAEIQTKFEVQDYASKVEFAKVA